MDFERIKKTARRQDLTIKNVLEKADIREATFYNCQKKGSIETKYLEKIAGVLGVQVGYFFNDNSLVNGNISSSNYQAEYDNLKMKNENLKALLKDKIELIKSKDEIIELLKSR